MASSCGLILWVICAWSGTGMAATSADCPSGFKDTSPDLPNQVAVEGCGEYVFQYIECECEVPPCEYKGEKDVKIISDFSGNSTHECVDSAATSRALDAVKQWHENYLVVRNQRVASMTAKEELAASKQDPDETETTDETAPDPTDPNFRVEDTGATLSAAKAKYDEHLQKNADRVAKWQESVNTEEWPTAAGHKDMLNDADMQTSVTLLIEKHFSKLDGKPTVSCPLNKPHCQHLLDKHPQLQARVHGEGDEEKILNCCPGSCGKAIFTTSSRFANVPLWKDRPLLDGSDGVTTFEVHPTDGLPVAWDAAAMQSTYSIWHIPAIRARPGPWAFHGIDSAEPGSHADDSDLTKRPPEIYGKYRDLAYSLPACTLPKGGMPKDAHMVRVVTCGGEENAQGVFCALVKLTRGKNPIVQGLSSIAAVAAVPHRSTIEKRADPEGQCLLPKLYDVARMSPMTDEQKAACGVNTAGGINTAASCLWCCSAKSTDEAADEAQTESRALCENSGLNQRCTDAMQLQMEVHLCPTWRNSHTAKMNADGTIREAIAELRFKEAEIQLAEDASAAENAVSSTSTSSAMGVILAQGVILPQVVVPPQVMTQVTTQLPKSSDYAPGSDSGSGKKPKLKAAG